MAVGQHLCLCGLVGLDGRMALLKHFLGYFLPVRIERMDEARDVPQTLFTIHNVSFKVLGQVDTLKSN